MTGFKDHFSGHANIYREARPTYPAELFAWLARQAPDTALAWDCGCGNSQATVALAERFAQVVGTDPSANKIAGAEARANIAYRVEPAEHSTLIDASASLVTVAQALHWFDFAPFYAEVRRVLKPGGVFAAWSYAACEVGDTAIDKVIDRLYVDLTGPYWPPESAYVYAGYRTLPFPFAEIATPSFPMRALECRAVARLSALMVGDAALHQGAWRRPGRHCRTRLARCLERSRACTRRAVGVSFAGWKSLSSGRATRIWVRLPSSLCQLRSKSGSHMPVPATSRRHSRSSPAHARARQSLRRRSPRRRRSLHGARAGRA